LEELMTAPPITEKHVADYRSEGVVLVRGLFKPWVEDLRAGIQRNVDEPGPFAAENLKPGETGRFFDDYCNWERIPEFAHVIRQPIIAEAAAALMQSKSVQMFHDHVLVKEAQTSKPTPWHQDAPYYFVEGRQTVSFWVPVDPVKEATLRCVAGSHLWDKQVVPTKWLSEASFYPDPGEYMPVPDPDAEGMPVREWAMEPGDAVAFNFLTLHGARGNASGVNRRAFSLRLVGDDVRYVERPGRTSPPYPGHGMKPGQVLRTDWFPFLLGGDGRAETGSYQGRAIG
jgi:ectoine hydroxylase-related dioxygenase (phytanoyl-CoA dioxygenase family)